MALFLAFGCWLFSHYIGGPNRWISAGNSDDTTLFEWWFAHGARVVSHGENPLFSMRQGVPVGVNVAANASLLGLTIPLAPLTMWLGPHLMVILVTALSLGLNACAGYYVLSRHLVGSRAAAAVGGAMYGFAPGVVEHAQGQLHLVANWVLPFIVLYTFRLAEPGRWRRHGIILGLLVTYQVFLGEAVLLVTVLATGTALLLYGVLRRAEARERIPDLLRGAAVAGVVALPLLAYPLWYGLRGPQHVRAVPPVTQNWSENLAAFVLNTGNSVVGDSALSRQIGWSEMTTWFGWPLCIALVVAAVALWRDSLAARIAVLTGLVFTAFALGRDITIGTHHTGVPGPWILVGKLPVFRMMPPGRMAYAVIGVAAVLLALLCDQLGRVPARQGRLVGYGLAVAALLPAMAMPLGVWPRVPAPHFFTSGDWRPYVPDGTTLVNFPLPVNYPGDGLEELGWQAQLDLAYAIPTGYALYPSPGRGPTSYNPPPRRLALVVFDVCRTGQLPPPLTSDDRVALRADLRYWHASVVVIWTGHVHAAELRTFTEDLLGPGRRVDDVWLWDVRNLTG